MTVHRPHPIVGPWPHDVRPGAAQPAALIDRLPTAGSVIYDDPDDALLFDGCDRCDEQATYPLSGAIDPVKTTALWRRMLDVERGDGLYLTHAESKACTALYGIAVWVERNHPAVDPWRWPWTVGPTLIPEMPR